MNIKFDLIPLVRVGPFKFGSHIKEHMTVELIQIADEYRESVDWKVYTIKDVDIRIYTDDDKIIAIGCYEQCIFNNIDLIGLSQKELLKIINMEPTEKDQINLDDAIEDVLEFDPLALQVYLRDDKVTAVIPSGSYKQED